MSNIYRIFGTELSPYSVKVRSYFRYKGIPHEWTVRHAGNMAEFQRHAKLPLVPLVLAPDGQASQDSTPIIETLEARFPAPPTHPTDPTLAFLSALIEEYGDEWGNKPMFHYRWFYEPDQRSAAARLARENLPDASEDVLRDAAETIRNRMVPRLRFVGSSAATKDLIERSFRRQLAILIGVSLVYGAGLSDGNRHTHEDLPTLVAGRGGKFFKTGHRIVYRKETPLANLFMTMIDRMGVSVEHFGDATGRLDGLDLS